MKFHYLSRLLIIGSTTLTWGCNGEKEEEDQIRRLNRQPDRHSEQKSSKSVDQADSKVNQNAERQEKESYTGMKVDPQIFIEAAFTGDTKKVKKALDAGADPEVADAEMRTPLMMAAYNGHTEVLKMLIEAGADVNRIDKNGRTPLMFASTGNFPKAVKLLLNKGADVNALDRGEGWTPLMFAAAEGQKEVVEILLEAGADKTVVDEDGDTAYSFAVQRQHTEVANMVSE
ncbi:MAG: ankyrin repeat domain-containing protein [Lentisphaeria bacterium]